MVSDNKTNKPTKTKRQQRRTSTRRKKKNNKILRLLPSKLLWLLIGVIAIIYVITFYRLFVKPYSFRWKALYGDIAYPSGSVRGIDISHYQNDIDWTLLRNAKINDVPIQFVFIKATEGSDMLDENFNLNFFNARENAIIRGAYHYFKPITPAIKQAKFYCKQVQLQPEDLPPVLDVEEKGDYSIPQLQKEVLAWLKYVEKHYGVKPILYTNHKFKVDYLNTPELNSYPYWIAHYYVDKLKYNGEWAFWQHTDVGHVDGIQTKVDINIFNGTRKELLKMCIKDDDGEMDNKGN